MGIFSFVAGFIAYKPENTPVFPCPSEASCEGGLPRRRRTSVAYFLTSLEASHPVAAHSSASSGETARYVAPKSVSGRVVNTSREVNFPRKLNSPINSNLILAPSDFPIQFLCAIFTRSDQSIFSKFARSFSAYFVIRKNHCSKSFFSISVSHRSHTPA